MRDVWLVGLGGFIGSVARYGLSGWITKATAAARFPFGTIAVNLVGCFVIGVVTGLIERHHIISPPARLFLITGMIGGFTTFSAFAYETYFLGREHTLLPAFANIGIQVVIGIGLLMIGHAAVR